MYELALFAGAGGGILGGRLLGWRCVCAVEVSPYARGVLVSRQNDGTLEPFPIWDDIRTFTKRNREVRPVVKALRRLRKNLVISGGFPCQDISSAGKGGGIQGEKSSLWAEMARIIGEIRPAHVWVENSPLLIGRGLGLVLADLAKMGYDARWGVMGAHHVGAPHARERFWLYAADAKSIGLVEMGEVQEEKCIEPNLWNTRELSTLLDDCPVWEDTKRGADLLADGLADYLGASKAAGNGQVPAVVEKAWQTLAEDREL